MSQTTRNHYRRAVALFSIGAGFTLFFALIFVNQYLAVILPMIATLYCFFSVVSGRYKQLEPSIVPGGPKPVVFIAGASALLRLAGNYIPACQNWHDTRFIVILSLVYAFAYIGDLLACHFLPAATALELVS